MSDNVNRECSGDDLLTQIRDRYKMVHDYLSDQSGSKNTFDLSPVVHSLRSAVTETDGQFVQECRENTPVQVDAGKMTAKFRITSVSRDRYGDVVLPQGCREMLPRYANNPVVFFGHKSNGFPIGSAANEDGSLSMSITDDVDIYSTLRCHGKTAESLDVFRLIESGDLRTASIGFLPILGEMIRKKDAEEDSPKNQVDWEPWYSFIFKKWELYEWSVVAVPANPDCIAMRLSRGFGGKQIAEPVARALKPYAAAAKEWAAGFAPEPVVPAPEPVLVPEPVPEPQKATSKEIGILKTVVDFLNEHGDGATLTLTQKAAAKHYCGALSGVIDSLIVIDKDVPIAASVPATPADPASAGQFDEGAMKALESLQAEFIAVKGSYSSNIIELQKITGRVS